MAAGVEGNPFAHYINILIPIATFFLGYLLTIFDQLRERKRKRKNLEKILLKELSENYKVVNRVAPGTKNVVPPPSLLAYSCKILTFDVFMAYLDRLDTLKPEQIDKLYDSYNAFLYVFRAALGFLETEGKQQPNKNNEPSDELVSKGAFLIVGMQRAYDRCRDALLVLPGGKAVLANLEKQSGAALDHISNLGEMDFRGRKYEKRY